MSKYQYVVVINHNIIKRMYQDHGYTIDEICMRLRYPRTAVELVIIKDSLYYGTKSRSC